MCNVCSFRAYAISDYSFFFVICFWIRGEIKLWIDGIFFFPLCLILKKKTLYTKSCKVISFESCAASITVVVQRKAFLYLHLLVLTFVGFIWKASTPADEWLLWILTWEAFPLYFWWSFTSLSTYSMCLFTTFPQQVVTYLVYPIFF